MDLLPSRLLERCPLCQAIYSQGEVKLLNGEGKTKLFHCSCQACGQAMLAAVFEGAGWLSSVGIITDLKAADATRLSTASPISSDDCIEMHDRIEGESQRLCRLLMDRAREPRT